MSTHAKQRLASSPQVSAWVSANAGTGKTYVLTRRVARLLLAGTDPSKILCITFTKAAAAEMKERLFSLLGEWSVMGDAQLADTLNALEDAPVPVERLPQARRLFARALETPGGLKIQTIHAFCEMVLKRFPLEAGVSPQFDVLDDAGVAEVLGEARARLTQKIAADPQCLLAQAQAWILYHVSDYSFEEIIRELISARDKLGTALAQGAAHAAQALYALLGVQEGQTEESILGEVLTGIDRDQIVRARDSLVGGSKNDQKLADKISTFLAAPGGDAAYTAYTECFFTQKGEPTKQLVTKGTAKAAPDIEAFLTREQDRLIDAEARRKAAIVAEASAALLTYAEALLHAYAEIKADRGLLDFADLVLRTRDLLRRSDVAGWVLYKLDWGLDHILLDEAQDTSPDQWDVVHSLAREFFTGDSIAEEMGRKRTIFVVGDEKQSIYSFQGAEPRAFWRMRAAFRAHVEAAQKRWEALNLDLSFRTVPTILSAVDTLFRHFPQGLTLAPEAEEPPEAAIHHLANREAQPGLVELWPVLKPEPLGEHDPWDAPLDRLSSASPAARLADAIGERIALMLERDEAIFEKDTRSTRAITPGAIMILVRRRDAFAEEMIRALKRREIPVAGADRMMLTEQLAVMDLIALGRFTLLPEDDLTLAALLKSPLVAGGRGLTEDQLFGIAHERKGSLWDALKRAGESDPALGEIAAALEALRRAAGFAAPFDFYTDVLGPKGGRRALLSRLGPDAADPIEEFLSAALADERDHTPSLEGFLHRLEHANAQIKRDMDQAGDQVRVMTVHGSKGLEAPVVFLPDTCRLPRAGSDALLWDEDPSDMPLWPVRKANEERVCTARRQAMEQAETEEYRRLLYVAMTRARDRLYVAGHEGTRKRDAGCWYDLVEAALTAEAETTPVVQEPVLPGGDPAWQALRLGEAPALDPAADGYDPETAPGPLPKWLFTPAPAEPLPPRPLSPSRLLEDMEDAAPEDAPAPAVISPLAAETPSPFRRGKLIHRLLQSLPDVAEAQRRGAAERYLAARAEDLTEAARADLAAETMAILEREDLRALFGPGSRAEATLAGRLGALGPDSVVEGRVDRLLVAPDKVLVVDYKTNRPPPQRVEDVPLAYLRQMAAYRALLRSLYPDRPVQASLIWTVGARVMPLDEALLEDVFSGMVAASRA